MSELFPPDLHYFNAALGWLELGNPSEAAEELNRVSAENQEHSEVLELRWEMSARQKQWEMATQVADRLIHTAPDRASGWIQRSYALHEMRRTKEAWDNLLPAAGKFSKDSTIPYNLACYACQLGRLEEARQWLGRAMEVGERRRIVAMARQDADLKPLWGEID